ncbi:hypothetical protein BH24ACT4_BH24ACT4_21120 [soil metagenome]
MRTSPTPMRRDATRRTLAVGLVAVLALVGVACSDDGGDDSTPTTTSPSTSEDASITTEAGGSNTTEEGATTTTEESGATTTAPAGEDGRTALTEAEAKAQLQSLMGRYGSSLGAIRARGSLDELSLQSLTAAFTATQARAELDGIRQLGGVQAIRPDAPIPQVGSVQLSDATATCAAGTVELTGVTDLVVTEVQAQPPYYFRLKPAESDAPSPGWRLDFLTFSTDGSPLDAGRCA